MMALERALSVHPPLPPLPTRPPPLPLTPPPPRPATPTIIVNIQHQHRRHEHENHIISFATMVIIAHYQCHHQQLLRFSIGISRRQSEPSFQVLAVGAAKMHRMPRRALALLCKALCKAL